MRACIFFTMLGLLTALPSLAEEFELTSGDARLQLTKVPVGGNYSLSFGYGDHAMGSYDLSQPLSLRLSGAKYDGRYTFVSRDKDTITCEGVISPRDHTNFIFTDRYTVDQRGGFRLSRNVEIEGEDLETESFNTIFGVQASMTGSIRDFEFFVPGIWYRSNFDTKMPGVLAANPSDQYFFFREDRLPLPVVTARRTSNGQTVSLVHLDSKPTTFAKEASIKNAVDSRMQFGSIGIRQKHGTTLAFMFPGSEGERNHVDYRSRNSWAHRSHPVRRGVPHRYELLIRFSTTTSYPNAVEESWKQAFDSYAPGVRRIDVDDAFQGLIETLEHYWIGSDPNGYDAPGFPFSVYLPKGDVRVYNYQMGFIGRQLPNAYFLIYQGYAAKNPSMRRKGEQILDFWAAQSLTDTGLPRTWYDPGNAGTRGSWRENDNLRGGTSMRVAATGMEGMLEAWKLEQEHGESKSTWLNACRCFGDWLVSNQNDDGSFFLAYDHQTSGNKNSPTSTSRFAAINPIRFLCMLYRATGEASYQRAALRASEFCLQNIHHNYSYVGSVIDNPNVIDRETGQEAIQAFLAIFDLTGEQRWLDAAVQAARYAETWMYAYEVPAEIGSETCDFPKDRSIVGQTLIATGHSAADLGFAFSSFDYYRLYLLTGDTHFLKVAQLLVHNTKQSMNWDGSLYPGKQKGLQLEAFKVTVPRRTGVMECLSWNYAAHLDPLIRFAETFGDMDLERIEKLPLQQRLKMENNLRHVR